MFITPYSSSVDPLACLRPLTSVLDELEHKQKERFQEEREEDSVEPTGSLYKPLFSTSAESPQKHGIKRKYVATPEKNKEACDLLRSKTEEETMASLIGQEQRILKEGIAALRKISDTPKKRKQSVVAERTFRIMIDIASPTTAEASPTKRFSSPKFHQDISDTLLESPWFSSTLEQVKKIKQKCRYPIEDALNLPPRVFKMGHITSPMVTKGKNVGFHFCPKENPLFSSLEEIVVNPATGVFCAKFRSSKTDSGASKYSSFFPSWIPDEENLLKLLIDGREIARFNNRSLCCVKAKPSFYFEAYDRERVGTKVVNSSFPIFSFDDLSNHYKGKLGGIIEVSQASLLTEATKMLRELIRSSIDLSQLPKNPMLQEEWLLRQPCKINDGISPLRFVIPSVGLKPSLLVFDFGPMFAKQTGIKKGLYVAIPQYAFKSVTGLSSILRRSKNSSS